MQDLATHDVPVAARTARAGRWVSVVSVAAILGWAVPALLMLGRGFAVEDEGTYVLSYRFWHSNPYFISGAQYFYGPVFEAVGESIPTLRFLRVVMVLGVNLWFGWSFVRWLERQPTVTLPVPRRALVLLMTAAGGLTYLWAPLTPGYYDLAGMATLSLVSLLLVTLAQSRRTSVWVPLLSGVVAVVLVITRWPAFPLPILTVGVSLWWLNRSSRAEAVRYAGWVAGGLLAAGVVVQVFLIPLPDLVRVLAKVSSLNAVGTHNLGHLAYTAMSSTLQLGAGAAVAAAPLALGLVGARAAQRRGNEAAMRWWLLGAAALTTFVLPFVAQWRGGGTHGGVVIGVVFGSMTVAMVAAIALHRGPLPGGSSGRVVAFVFVVVPFLQAAGTDVPLLYLAGECLALWVALALLLIARPGCPAVTTMSVLTYLSVMVVATAMIGGTTTLMTPFKTASFSEDTVTVPHLGLRLDSETAAQYAAVASALEPYVERGRTPVITLDQLGGLTYLLGGVPAGSTWTSEVSPSRTAGILALACRNGDVPRDHPPVLIIDRTVDAELSRAMAGCGIPYPSGYRVLDVPGGPPDLQVLVPGSTTSS